MLFCLWTSDYNDYIYNFFLVFLFSKLVGTPTVGATFLVCVMCKIYFDHRGAVPFSFATEGVAQLLGMRNN